MKIIVNTPKETIQSLMRKVGYFFDAQDAEKGDLSFLRPLEKSGYPRFHIYATMEQKDLVLHLHLDQKRPVYQGTTAHSGEYEGPLVEQEGKRIQQLLRAT